MVIVRRYRTKQPDAEEDQYSGLPPAASGNTASGNAAPGNAAPGNAAPGNAAPGNKDTGAGVLLQSYPYRCRLLEAPEGMRVYGNFALNAALNEHPAEDTRLGLGSAIPISRNLSLRSRRDCEVGAGESGELPRSGQRPDSRSWHRGSTQARQVNAARFVRLNNRKMGKNEFLLQTQFEPLQYAHRRKSGRPFTARTLAAAFTERANGDTNQRRTRFCGFNMRVFLKNHPPG